MTNQYTHHVYADASGDDGFKFEDKDHGLDGSSYWFAIAPIIMEAEDVSHNKQIVLDLKRTIGLRPRDEITWRRLRKHRRRQEALNILSELRLRVVAAAAGKQVIRDLQLRDPKAKVLSALLHTFWLRVLLEMFPTALAKSILVMIDNYKAGLVDFEKVVRDYARRRSARMAALKENQAPRNPFQIEFRPSTSIQLLQLADIFAGMVRDLFEGLRGQQLPPCAVCLSKRWRGCTFKSSRRIIGDPTLVMFLQPYLARGLRDRVWEYGILVRPPQLARRYYFVECLWK